MKRVLLVGPIFNQSGYGEHARLTARALRQNSGVDLFILPTKWANSSFVSSDSEENDFFKYCAYKHQSNAQGEKRPYDISIQVTVPNEYQKFAPVNIGVTAGVESDKASIEFVNGCNLMDKIITISSFSKDVLQSTKYNIDGVIHKIECPIEFVGYPVKSFETQKESDFNFETKFNFLTVGQLCPRRNLESTVKWFIEEFHDNKNVGLVIKTSFANNCTQDRFFTEAKLKELTNRFPNKKCSVYLLHGPMSDSEMDALYKHEDIKCFVTNAHGEGFGLPVFESAYNGLPVIAPDYSGYRDFLYHQKVGDSKKKPFFATVDYVLKPVQKHALMKNIIVEDSNWAYPKEQSCKTRMLEVYKDYGRFKKQANSLKEIVRNAYSSDKIYSEFNSFISEYVGENSFESFFDVSDIE